MKKFLVLMVMLIFIIFMSGCVNNQQESFTTFNPKITGSKYVGSKACEDCHDELVEKFQNNVHMQIANFEAEGNKKGCEGCHGPASAHIDNDGDKSLIISFNSKDVPAQVKSSVCTSCHNKGELSSWHGSTHNLSNVACSDCHDIHKGNGKNMLKAKTVDKLCLNCHKDKIGRINMPSHHPLKEGKMTCADCHNPHNGENKFMLRTTGRLNDLCFKCHADKEGPFVFEHAPVTEKCTICHEPHGTVANNLLRNNEPFLCLQCHHLHFHAGLRGNEHVGIGSVFSVQQVMTTKCTQCHTQIHGSNLPSNTRSGMGRRMTR